jgi:hypothetical protein
VPDRGPNTHTVPTAFDVGAGQVVRKILLAARVKPIIHTDPELIDTRVLKAPGGYVVPLANYNATVGQKVTLTLQLDREMSKVVSAYHGPLRMEKKDAAIVVTIPALGYGDMLRLTKE